MYEYPINIHQEPDHFWSTCPDIPEAHSAADSADELVRAAQDGITLALTIYVDRNIAIPQASAPSDGQRVVLLPATVIAKITLWNAMVAKGMRVADLARKLSLSHTVASRLVDMEHNSKIEQVEAALFVLGYRLRIVPELIPESLVG